MIHVVFVMRKNCIRSHWKKCCINNCTHTVTYMIHVCTCTGILLIKSNYCLRLLPERSKFFLFFFFEKLYCICSGNYLVVFVYFDSDRKWWSSEVHVNRGRNAHHYSPQQKVLHVLQGNGHMVSTLLDQWFVLMQNVLL